MQQASRLWMCSETRPHSAFAKLELVSGLSQVSCGLGRLPSPWTSSTAWWRQYPLSQWSLWWSCVCWKADRIGQQQLLLLLLLLLLLKIILLLFLLLMMTMMRATFRVAGQSLPPTRSSPRGHLIKLTVPGRLKLLFVLIFYSEVKKLECQMSFGVEGEAFVYRESLHNDRKSSHKVLIQETAVERFSKEIVMATALNSNSLRDSMQSGWTLYSPKRREFAYFFT